MQSLKNVVTALQQEIETALGPNQSLPNGTRLAVDRVVATLQFIISERGENTVSFTVPSRETAADRGGSIASPLHSLAIEFKFVPSSPNNFSNAVSRPLELSAAKTAFAGDEADQVTRDLTAIFG